MHSTVTNHFSKSSATPGLQRIIHLWHPSTCSFYFQISAEQVFYEKKLSQDSPILAHTSSILRPWDKVGKMKKVTSQKPPHQMGLHSALLGLGLGSVVIWVGSVIHKVRIIFTEKVSVSISLLLLIWYGGNIFGFTKTDVTSVILSHECATLSRAKLADAATVGLHAATLSRNQTRLLHHFSRFTILLHKHSSKMAKFFNI